MGLFIIVRFPEIMCFESDHSTVTCMDYSKMTPVLLEAIKAQQNQIEALKNEIQSLHSVIAGVQ